MTASLFTSSTAPTSAAIYQAARRLGMSGQLERDWSGSKGGSKALHAALIEQHGPDAVAAACRPPDDAAALVQALRRLSADPAQPLDETAVRAIVADELRKIIARGVQP